MANLKLSAYPYHIEVVPAKGKSGGYRLHMHLNTGRTDNQLLVHELLFANKADAALLAGRINGRNVINLNHWVWGKAKSYKIKELAMQAPARYKTQLFRMEF